jgi:hypothetical protein
MASSRMTSETPVVAEPRAREAHCGFVAGLMLA